MIDDKLSPTLNFSIVSPKEPLRNNPRSLRTVVNEKRALRLIDTLHEQPGHFTRETSALEPSSTMCKLISHWLPKVLEFCIMPSRTEVRDHPLQQYQEKHNDIKPPGIPYPFDITGRKNSGESEEAKEWHQY